MRITFLAVLIFLFSGCAAKVNKESVQPSNQAIPLTNIIYLDISSLSTVPESKDLNNSIYELQNLLSKEFGNKLLPISDSNKEGTGLFISIENYRHVSGFGRFMGGIMVGKAVLRLNVKLVDLATNSTIVDSNLDSRSEWGEGIFGATTSRQLEAMAKEIVKIVSNGGKNG